jgi:hypothetical protein
LVGTRRVLVLDITAGPPFIEESIACQYHLCLLLDVGFFIEIAGRYTRYKPCP